MQSLGSHLAAIPPIALVYHFLPSPQGRGSMAVQEAEGESGPQMGRKGRDPAAVGLPTRTCIAVEVGKSPTWYSIVGEGGCVCTQCGPRVV